MLKKIENFIVYIYIKKFKYIHVCVCIYIYYKGEENRKKRNINQYYVYWNKEKINIKKKKIWQIFYKIEFNLQILAIYQFHAIPANGMGEFDS